MYFVYSGFFMGKTQTWETYSLAAVTSTEIMENKLSQTTEMIWSAKI